jgi:transposase
MDRDSFWLSDEQFARLKPHLPSDTRGKPRVDDRRVIGGIIHVLKCGCRWIDAPSAYGPRKTLYNRFVRWAAKGVWEDIFHALDLDWWSTRADLDRFLGRQGASLRRRR